MIQDLWNGKLKGIGKEHQGLCHFMPILKIISFFPGFVSALNTHLGIKVSDCNKATDCKSLNVATDSSINTLSQTKDVVLWHRR